MRIPIVPKFVAVAAAVLGLAAGGIGVAAASTASDQPTAAATPSPKQTPARASFCADFVSHLAADLGKSRDATEDAIDKAAKQTIDDAVAKGALTSQQAQRLKDALSKNGVCSGALSNLLRHRAAGILAKARAAYLNAAAKTLGISVDELKQDLKSGQSLHQVADSKNISESQFRSSLINTLTPLLDKAVKDGKLTKQQEQTILQHLKNGKLPLWDRSAAKEAAPSASASGSA
jgi:polyhydroxyalkanoate synthesis regulator phasin